MPSSIDDPSDGRRGAAFFDLDRTLISGSSAIPFAVAAWRNDLIPVADFARDALNGLMFRLSGASDDKSAEVRDRILGAVAGVRRDALVGLNDEIIPVLLSKVRPEAQELVERHREAGRDVWIVSASPQELVGPLAEMLGITGGIGTSSELVDGVYTGQLDGPFVYGDGKREAIAALAEERGYDLRLSWSYTDSVSDLPMLEMVGHAVAVNPDAALERLAQRRNWPIVVFSRKTKTVVRRTSAGTGAAGLAVAGYLLGRHHGHRAEALHPKFPR